ncbi:MAG: STAS/SEC14 domain-containing protein [Cyclobacteriaceae bacterium]|nr:STAS/SEC14 domain-containing protein [Cyclobacteriaceae bacterium]
MIEELKDTPNTMVGFKASGEITKEDFDKIVLPAVAELVQRTGKLNYLLELDTKLSNFTLGAWLKDAMLGLNNLTNWNRAAIVTDSEKIKTFTEVFSKIVPGEFRGFPHDELDEAIKWVGEQSGTSPKQVFQDKAKIED